MQILKSTNQLFLVTLGKPWVFGLVIYLALAVILFSGFDYQANPDGISYINIARLYLSHDFKYAVNGYWSPLFSWLLIPFLYLGFSPLIAARILLLLAGLFSLFQVSKLLQNIELKTNDKKIGLVFCAIMLISYVYAEITPDLLFLAIALAVINLLYVLSKKQRSESAILCGVFGGFLYFSKAFGMPYFFALFTLASIFMLLEHNGQQYRILTIRNYLLGTLSFVFVVAPWILLISQKYGHATIATAGAYNHAILGPAGHGHPMHYLGLITPPYIAATSIWDDISTLPIDNWSVLDSVYAIFWQIKLWAKNSALIAYDLSVFTIFGLPVVGSCLLVLIKRHDQKSFEISIAALLLLLLGYSLLVVEQRYLWLSALLVLALGIRFLRMHAGNFKNRYVTGNVALLIFCLSFLYYPVATLIKNYNNGRDIFILAKEVGRLKISGNVASDYNWQNTLFLSFYNGWRYFGENGRLTASEVVGSLKEKEIQYYLVWSQDSDVVEQLQKCNKVSSASGLDIYDVRNCL